MDENSSGLPPTQYLPSDGAVGCSLEALGFIESGISEADNVGSCKLGRPEFVLDGDATRSFKNPGLASTGMDETHEFNDTASSSSSPAAEQGWAGNYEDKTNLMRNSKVSTGNHGNFLDWKDSWGTQYGFMGSVFQTPAIETQCIDMMSSNSFSSSIRSTTHPGRDSSQSGIVGRERSFQVEIAGMKNHGIGSATVSQIAITNINYAPLDYSQVQFHENLWKFRNPNSPSNSIMSAGYSANQTQGSHSYESSEELTTGEWSNSGVLSSHGNQVWGTYSTSVFGNQNWGQANGNMSSNRDAVGSSFLLNNHQGRAEHCTFLGCTGCCFIAKGRKTFGNNLNHDLMSNSSALPSLRSSVASNRLEEPYYSITGQNQLNSPYEKLKFLQQTPFLPKQMPSIPIVSKLQDACIRILAVDGIGSRHLLKLLATKDRTIIAKIFNALSEIFHELINDHIGIRLFRKLLHLSEEDQIREIVYRLTKQDGALITASYDDIGTVAIQKLIETIKRSSDSSQLVREVMLVLAPESLNLMTNQWGSRVIKHCILNFSNTCNDYLIHVVAENCVLLSENRWGYLIVKDCIRSMGNPYKTFLLSKIVDNAMRLSKDSLGNFVIQDVLESHIPDIVQRICCHELKGKYASLSMKKFSSRVVEKCIRSPQIETVVEELLISKKLHNVICDPFGNYVIQTALRTAKDKLLLRLVETISVQRESFQHHPFASNVFKISDEKKKEGGSTHFCSD